MILSGKSTMNSQNIPTAPIYILGGGPAGLASAYTLVKKGYPVVVVERDQRVGGLAKSITYQDFILDFGPHRFFTKLSPVLKLWDEVLGEDQVTVDRLTRIFYGGKYFSYPLKGRQVLLALGWAETLKIITSYFWARIFPIENPNNFAEWVKNKFGKRLFEIFFQSYTEKLWGIPCTEISADWAAQRIKGLSLMQAAKNALFGNDGKVKTLIDQFQFPRLGSGQLYDKIADFLIAHDQQVLLNTEVVKIHQNNYHVQQITLRDRQTGEEKTVDCSGVISSIPITHLLQQIETPAPPTVLEAAQSLKFRNTVLVYLMVESGKLFPDNWLYINEPSVELGRVTNFANWSPAMLPNNYQTPLCCEYWCNFDEPMWQMSEAELMAKAEEELRRVKLLHHEKISSGFVVRLPRTYPIYAGDYKHSLNLIQTYLEHFTNLQLVGRYGAFKYNNQDHSLLMGILAAENVITPGKHDLWSVNSDSEYAEEAKADEATTATTGIRVSKRRKAFNIFSQLGGYLVTGGSATIIDVVVFSLLTSRGMWFVLALCISYTLGLTTNFWLSRRYVFGIYWHNWVAQYFVFAAVALNSLLANLGLLQLLVNEAGWNATWARLVSAGCVAVLSFTGHKLYSFANEKSFGRQGDVATNLDKS
jgi:protoporphyrinogen oxidase/putative flippase GtrA